LTVIWLPLVILSAVQGLALGQQVQIPFLRDFAANARFLIAVPLLIIPETATDRRLRMVVCHFLKSGLVKDADLTSFEAVLQAITRLRNHILPELVMLAVAYLPSLSKPGGEVLLSDLSSWHFMPAGHGETLSCAGWWFRLVSAPFFRFLALQWIWRIFLWALFLWRASRLNLALTPTHPDMAAGLGFLAEGQMRFGPVAFAGGVLLAGQIQNALVYEGATLAGMKFIIIVYCVFAMAVLLAPLLLLCAVLWRVRKRGILEYGALASSYVQMFDAKWIQGRPAKDQSLLGTADIQSLADLNNSFAIVRDMRLVPIDKRTLIVLAAAAILPIIPVLIFATPANTVIQTVLKLLA
jgi:hypothetical protein